METHHYLAKLRVIAEQLRQNLFSQKQLELKAGTWLNSAVLKIQKPAWRNHSAIPFEQFIFFSIWVNERSAKQNKVYYNIHALKLRELKGYTIKSRQFAEGLGQILKILKSTGPM
jgi:hypothetical protein